MLLCIRPFFTSSFLASLAFKFRHLRQTENTNDARIVTDRKKVESLISVVGAKTYSTLQDLCKPDRPNAKIFLLQQHFQPKQLEVAEAFKFHRCVQSDCESVSDFTARLHRVSSACGLGGFLA